MDRNRTKQEVDDSMSDSDEPVSGDDERMMAEVKTEMEEGSSSDEHETLQSEENRSAGQAPLKSEIPQNVIPTIPLLNLGNQLPIIINTVSALAQQSIFALTNPTLGELGNSAPKPAVSTVPVVVSAGTTVHLQKYFCQAGLCRVCFLVKEKLFPLLQDVDIDASGAIETSRTSQSKFHLLTALKFLLGIEVKYNDGLPSSICLECYDQLASFSAFRRKIDIGQTKLSLVMEKVKDSNTPTFIPSLGETDDESDIYKHPLSIVTAKKLLGTSKYCHCVVRSISDRSWDSIFISFSKNHGSVLNSDKLQELNQYVMESPYVLGFFCLACNVTIHGTKDDFAKHQTDSHQVAENDVIYPCDVCGSSFPLNSDSPKTKRYSEHWLEHFFLNECKLCKKRLPSLRSLNIHTKSHKKGRQFVCDVDGCNEIYYKKATFDEHRLTHPGFQIPRKTYPCDLCEETFQSYGGLKDHLIRHKGEKTELCHICSKQFFSISRLKSHMLSHETVGTFVCEVCQKAFKRKRYLIEHARIHTDEMPFSCEICQRKFRMKSNYFKHLKIHKKEGSA